MSDTQWPRFQVFHQERRDRPHLNVGTVHAPDAEMALLNARDVFVRRPDCVSLWVVPADQITSRTAQEMEALTLPDAGNDAEVERYCVFVKLRNKGSHEFVGFVEAASPEGALVEAKGVFGEGGGYVWWVFPERWVTRTEEGDLPSMFEPAHGKGYRDQVSYSTHTLMRRLQITGSVDEGGT